MKMMNRVLQIFFAVTALGCSKNILQGSSTSTTDDMLLTNAKIAINSFDYQTAINIITLQMSAAAQAQTTPKEVLASAYAGKCGLNFVDYLDKLSHVASGTGFGLMMLPFVGIAVDPPSCLLSLQALDSIGTTAQRTANENAFAAIVGMSLVGTQTRSANDKTPVNGDGTIDQNICNMTDPQLTNMVLGFGHMILNFSYLTTSQIGGTSQTAINNIIAACSSAAGGANCAVTDPAAVTQPLRYALRNLLNTDDYGVGPVHTGGDPTLIATACP
jgi:hypothetical protein